MFGYIVLNILISHNMIISSDNIKDFLKKILTLKYLKYFLLFSVFYQFTYQIFLQNHNVPFENSIIITTIFYPVYFLTVYIYGIFHYIKKWLLFEFYGNQN
jgi:hypothetical protein